MKDEVYIELAVGQGETLASANQQGTPYRVIYNKTSKKVKIVSFANYSFGLFSEKKSIDLVKKRVDYSQISFTKDISSLEQFSNQLGQIATKIQAGFNNFP